MRKLLGVVAVAVVAVAVAGYGAAVFGADAGGVQSASGTVVAVTEASRTIVVESRLRGQPWIIGAEVPEDAKIEGKAKSLKEIKEGDKVTIRFVRKEHGDVATGITVR